MPSAKGRFAHLVLEVVPLEAGAIRIDGADIAYSSGLRRGSQASGVEVEVEVAAVG